MFSPIQYASVFVYEVGVSVFVALALCVSNTHIYVWLHQP